MRRLITLVAVCVLMIPLSACGTSDSEISTATIGAGGAPRPTNPNTVPVTPNPTVPAGATKPANMTDQEFMFAIDVFNRVNEYRAMNGRAALTWNADVAHVAQRHTISMENATVLTHSSLPPNPACTVPPMFCHAVRLSAGDPPAVNPIAWTRATENVARGQISAEEVMNAWIASPGHNANLLDAGVSQLGVGVRLGGAGPWWTQNFIQP